MAEKQKNLCAMIPAELHSRVRAEQERSGRQVKNAEQTGQSLVRFAPVCVDFPVFCLELSDTPLDKLFDFLILCAALVSGNDRELVQQNLWNPERIARQAVFHIKRPSDA